VRGIYLAGEVTHIRDRFHILSARGMLGSGTGRLATQKSYTYRAHAHWTMYERGILEASGVSLDH